MTTANARTSSVRISATTRARARLRKLAEERGVSVPDIVETLSYATDLEMQFLSEDRKDAEKEVKR